MEWQDYTVWAVGLSVAAVIIRRAVRLLRSRGRSGCDSCADGTCPKRRSGRR